PISVESVRRDFIDEIAMQTGVPAALIRTTIQTSSYHDGTSTGRNYQRSTIAETLSVHTTVAKYAEQTQDDIDSITFHIYQRAPFHILEKGQGKRHKTVHGVT